MLNAASLKDMEVIDINNGKKLGIVEDMEIDFEKGKIVSVIIPGPGKLVSFFGKDTEIVIPWECIKKVGIDIILVDMKDDYQEKRDYQKKQNYQEKEEDDDFIK